MPPNHSLELTPSVRALYCSRPSVGIRPTIESSWERSSAPSRYAPLAAAHHADRVIAIEGSNLR